MTGPRWRYATCVLVVGLAGCGSDASPDLVRYVERVDARPAPAIDAIPEPAPYVPYRYTPGGRRAIFTPSLPASAAGNDGLRPDRSRPAEPLEAYSLDALTLVGVLRMRGASQALIKTPGGIVHRVGVGAYLGQHDGRVTAIAAERVSLVEIVPDGQGGYTQRDTVLVASSDSRS